jgi:arginine decarboxylase
VIIKTPTHYFLVSGASEGLTPLNAFDGALLSAGIGDTNLVKMSSIVPPRCHQISPVSLPPGSLVPTAYACITSDIPGEIISSAVAVALPKEPHYPGLIMEYSARGSRADIEETVRRMALEGMRLRMREIKDLQSIAVEHRVQKVGATLAAVVLWDREDVR